MTLNADMYSTFMRTRSNIVRLKGQSSEKCSEGNLAVARCLFFPARLPATLHRRCSWKMQPAAMVVVFVLRRKGPSFDQKRLAKNRTEFKDLPSVA